MVDDITGDDLSCGVLWHVELAGVPFPNGRGASFYRLSPESRKLVYARDVVEPPFKPGAAAFVIIRAVAPLVARTLKKAEGGTSDQPDVAAASLSPVGLALGAAAAFYTFALILSPPDMYAPGEPIWMITPETVKEVTDESINFFFVNIFLQDLGIGLQADAHHPVSEGLFNLVNAYSFMFLPVLLRSERSRGMNTYAWWSVQMFLTNAVMMSYLCKRELTLEDRRADPETPKEAGRHALLSKAFGATGGAMGAFCLWWTLAARPELGGDIQARVEHLQYLLGNDRVAFAFAADMVIYSAWQVILIGELDKQRGRAAPAWMRYTPFLCVRARARARRGKRALCAPRPSDGQACSACADARVAPAPPARRLPAGSRATSSPRSPERRGVRERTTERQRAKTAPV